MKANYETYIIGEKCILVPYRPEHVPRYHEWMQDVALLEATGSERMTLKEEVENQESWRDDETKCTFIVLVRDECTLPSDDGGDIFDVAENLHAMAGDVNLFLSEQDTDEEIDPFGPPPPAVTEPAEHYQAEVDIMIAEERHRNKGLGKEATILAMLYGSKVWEKVRRLFCKINDTNTASKRLFEERLGFTEKEYIAVFSQYELELSKETNQELLNHLCGMLDRDLVTVACPLKEELAAHE